LEILAREVGKDFHFLIFGTVPMIPKILETAKTDPAKAKASANTKPRSQHFPLVSSTSPKHQVSLAQQRFR
jgi:hypothetical protein